MIEPSACVFTRERQLRRALAGIRYSHDVLKAELNKIIKNKKASGTEAPEAKITSSQEVRSEEC